MWTKTNWRLKSIAKALLFAALLASRPALATGPPPVILVQPLSQIVLFQGSVTFSVVASSGTTMTYQWTKDGTVISGAIGSSYTIPAVQPTDAGAYAVKVTNGGGTVSSSDATLTVLSAPQITTQPASQGVVLGQPASFSVQATGPAPLSYQWSYNGTAISGATLSSLAINSAQMTDAGAYSVVVGNLYGSTASSNANLSVFIVPTMTAQPQGTNLLAGYTANLMAAATGSPAPTYQWRLNGTNLPGATNTILLRTNIQPNASGDYTLVASNPGGSVTSQVATVTVIPLVQQSWVARFNGGNLTNQDIPRALATDSAGNVYVTGSSPATNGTYDIVTIKYDASGNQVWLARYDGGINGNDEPTSITLDSSGNVYVAGYTTIYAGASGTEYVTLSYSSTGSLRWKALYDSGGYSADKANKITTDTNGNVYVTGVGTKSSGADFATVKYNSSGQQQWVARYDGTSGGYDEARSIGLDSAGNIYVAGASTGTGTGLDIVLVKYNTQGNQQWVQRYNGSNALDDIASSLAIDSQDNIYVAGTAGTTTNADFVLLKYSTDGTRQWVRRTNGPGTGRDEAYALALDGFGNAYCAGLATTATGYDYATLKTLPDGTAQWGAFSGFPGNEQVAGLAVDYGGNVYVTGTVSNNFVTLKYSPAGGSLWTAVYDNGGVDQATAICLDASGNVLVAGSSAGTDAGDFVVVKYSQPAAVNIVTQPTNQFIAGGATAVFTGAATGYGPVSYQWYYKGTALSGATDTTLTINNAGVNTAGDYFFTASNVVNVVASTKVKLLVPPVISAQPTNATVIFNKAASFSVTVQNTDSVGYLWYFNGAPIAGATSRTYALSKAKTSNAGNYQVVITNAAGSTTSLVATLTVLVPATVSTPPRNLTVNQGDNGDFSVTASGTAPIIYQWYFNGSALPDATNSLLHLSNVQSAQAGNYSVSVANVAGSETSTDAILTVIIPPAITGQPQDRSVIAGQTVTLNVAVAGSGPLTYQWSLDGSPLAGATNSALVLAPAQTSDSGHYCVTVTNTAGMAVSAAAAVSVAAPVTLSNSSSSLSPNGFTFQFSAPPGTTYVIEACTNFQDWAPIATNVVDAALSGPVVFTDTNSSAYASRFYRVSLP
jgi:uncharacterized delta-60 repeat protein